MTLPEKRDELNRVDEQAALRRMDEERGACANVERIDEHHREEDRELREQRRLEEEHRAHGHDFAMDVHPERYPRATLSRLESGILEDDEARHAHDHLGTTLPDLEDRIDDARNLSRTLVVLGSCLLIFSWVLLLWVGWDIRDGKDFFTGMWIVAFVIGLGLVAWGYFERRHITSLLELVPRSVDRERIEQRKRERELWKSDTAA